MFQTREDDAAPTMMRFGYSKSRVATRRGLTRCAIFLMRCTLPNSRKSSIFFRGIVSGRRKSTNMVASPPRALCNQKIALQVRKVTIIPPMNGPKAGPTSAPLRNQPKAVPRSIGEYMSPRHELPMIKNDVPWKAVRIRNTKKAGRFGARAVPMLKAKNKAAEETQI
jgi:hypothetical protein